MKTHGRTIDEMVLRQPAGLKAALGENPKRVYGDQKKTPSHPHGLGRPAARAAGQGAELPRQGAARATSKPFERDLRLEALGRVLRREMPLRLHAHRADDIMTALRIRDEFGFDMTIEHAPRPTRSPTNSPGATCR